MRLFHSLGLMSLCLFLFQNCGEFAAEEREDIYTYDSRTDFFYDVKLITTEVASANRKRYVFDFAVSFASNPNQSVGYQLQFSTLNFVGVCRTTGDIVDGVGKHFRSECLMPTLEDIYIQLTLTGPENENVVDQFRF